MVSVISYQVDNHAPVKIAAGTPAFGPGVALTGNVVRFLQSLPETGDLVLQMADQNGVVQNGSFSLRGMQKIRQRLAVACNW